MLECGMLNPQAMKQGGSIQTRFFQLMVRRV
uniref:Uncharacterized protein n=1 Tax=Arundo donax TaxID=35708 RepID=A0A0A9GNY4_ARUDO